MCIETQTVVKRVAQFSAALHSKQRSSGAHAFAFQPQIPADYVSAAEIRDTSALPNGKTMDRETVDVETEMRRSDSERAHVRHVLRRIITPSPLARLISYDRAFFFHVIVRQLTGGISCARRFRRLIEFGHRRNVWLCLGERSLCFHVAHIKQENCYKQSCRLL